jgi:hypothetical protein
MLKLYKMVLGALLSCTMLQAQAAASKVETFDKHSWQRLQKELPRPAAIIFSTTDCAHCPAIIANLAEQIKNRKPQIPLVVVVMDGDGQTDLLQEPHYQTASRLFVFNGQTAALQFSVHPNWRGITPYVALLPRLGETKLVLGKPSAIEIDSWLDVSKK